MTTPPTPLTVKTRLPERQLTLEQEGRLRVIDRILSHDRSRPVEEVEALLELVLYGLDDEEGQS